MTDQILSLLVSNHFGVLTRVTNLFSRRGYNIKELTVGETDNPEISRITILTQGDDPILEQIQKQLQKLEDVKKVALLPQTNHIDRELLLIKISSQKAQLAQIQADMATLKGGILHSESDYFIIEAMGETKNIDQFIQKAKNYGILEMCRTGATALQTGKNTIYDN